MPLSSVVPAIARSFTGRTGALIGGVAGAAPVLAIFFAEMALGRPSSTAGIVLLIALVLGIVGAMIGLLIGWSVHLVVRRTRWAGRVSRPVVAVTLALVVVLSSAFGINQVSSVEASNEPRVISSTGAVARVAAASAREPRLPSTLMYGSLPEVAKEVQELRWNGRVVRVEVSSGTLRLLAEGSTPTNVDVSGFDYVREVYGVTARLQAGPLESLVLLVRLRATGRRELVLIHDPSGMLVHQELLERTGRQQGPLLWRAGSETGPHDVAIDVGTPIHYAGRR